MSQYLPTDRLRQVSRHLPTDRLRHAGRQARGSLVVLLLLLVSAVPSAMAGSSNSRPATEAGGAAEAADRALAARAEAATTASRSRPRSGLPADELGAAPKPQADGPEQQPKPKEDKADDKADEQKDKKDDQSAKDEEVTTKNVQNDGQQEADLEPPAPIGGLNQRQMEHATTIVRVGQELGLPQQAYVVALATALQESYLRVLASPVYPESSGIPNDGMGFDHDSVGLFQQRPSSGWGTVAECMDPATSARIFYSVLQQVPGWQDLPITVAAQTVQVSAFPDHYAQHEPLARDLVAAITNQ